MMLRDKLYRFFKFCSARKKTIYLLIIILALGRFCYLNYINWTCGKLCTGHGGIQYGYDYPRYLDGAERLVNNHPLSDLEPRYVGYILLIALTSKFGLDLAFVLLIQLCFALLAAWALYDLGRSITHSRLTGLLAAGFFLVNPFIVQWQLFIHTESYYSSMLVLSAWSIYKAVSNKKIIFYILSAVIVFYTASIRPNGWAMIPIFFCFAIISLKINYKIKLIVIALISLIFVFIVSYVLLFKNDLRDVNTYDMFIKGEIIWGHVESSQHMPQAALSENNDYMSGLNYMFQHPIAVTKLFFRRITTELIPIYRPWNSLKFIIRFLLWMLPAYIFAVFGLKLLRKNMGVAIVMTIIISHLCIIGLTCADQEFRFLMYILPLIILMGALGLHVVCRRVLKIYNIPENHI